MLKRWLPHLCFILSLMMLTFFVVDKFNPGMNFVGNEVFKILLVIYSAATAVMAAIMIVINRRSRGK